MKRVLVVEDDPAIRDSILDLLEAEVDDLTRAVRSLEEESQFLHRLLESTPRSTLPPSANP